MKSHPTTRFSRRDFLQSAVGLTGAALAASDSAAAEAAPASGAQASEPATHLPKIERRDYCSKPFRVAVALGESTTAGGTATDPAFTWVRRLEELINEAQLQPVKMINSGIGGN